MKKKLFNLTAALTLMVMALSSTVFADDSQLLDLVKGMENQMKQMQKTINDQNSKIQRLETRPAASSASENFSSTPIAAAPMSDYEFNQRLDAATGGAQKWLKDLTFKGDMRLRYEAFSASSGNPASSQPRNRFRFRLRYGFEKKFSDEMLVGFSMASGDSLQTNGLNGDPTSTNATLSNNFNFKNIFIEKAYATYMPNWAKVGPIKKLTITGGKFDNPFEKGASDMVWDRDVKPEGIIEKVDFGIIPEGDFTASGWLTGGQMPTKENAASSSNNSDATLFAEQVGLNALLYLPELDRPLDYTTAVSFYNWNHYAKNNNFLIGAGSLARGNSNVTGNANSLDAGDFKVIEFYNELAFYPFGLPVRPYADFAHNMGAQNVDGSTGTHQNSAWSMGMKLGGIVKKGDWEALYQYKYIEANALPGFNDSDFGYAGHSGHAGNVFKLGYGITDTMTLNLAAYLVRNLNADTNGIVDQQEKRFQTDLVWKF